MTCELSIRMSKPLGCGCELFPTIQAEDDEFWHRVFALRAEEYELPMH
jgi:hypothetical protein